MTVERPLLDGNGEEVKGRWRAQADAEPATRAHPLAKTSRLYEARGATRPGCLGSGSGGQYEVNSRSTSTAMSRPAVEDIAKELTALDGETQARSVLFG